MAVKVIYISRGSLQDHNRVNVLLNRVNVLLNTPELLICNNQLEAGSSHRSKRLYQCKGGTSPNCPHMLNDRISNTPDPSIRLRLSIAPS